MRRLALSLFLILFGVPALAALQFPALTGRVVDDAHILSPHTVAALDQKLAEYEAGTTNQVVVVTLPSLQGTSIEDYGYQLGRAWGIGQKGKDNGALLIIAPNERKVRIEVGYGLEPLLTDAASSEIVHGIILPAFKAGNMGQGIIAGTDAMLSILGGHSLPLQAHQGTYKDSPLFGFLVLALLLAPFILAAMGHPFAAYMLMSSTRYGGSSLGSSGWGGGGGFSGGGGSFGGGGASGSW